MPVNAANPHVKIVCYYERTMLETRTIMECFFWPNCPEFPYVSIDFVNKLTSDCPHRSLYSTPRPSLHWNIVYRFFTN